MTRHIKPALPLIALAFIMGTPCEAPAIPAFSRQIHADCRTCHFQDMHALNAYGRAFKLNGFRESEKMRQKRLQREREKKSANGKTKEKP